jgi:acetylglutamate kinase
LSRIVVKVGGAVAGRSAEAVLELATEHNVCVVHGAGPQISVEMERAGIQVEFLDGLRVTNASALEIVRASLETVNAALCAAIGERAVPFFGHEVGLQARQLERYGRVGEVDPQAVPAVVRVLEAGKIPVLAPLALEPGGGLLNVNADDVAAAIAVGMEADRLLFLTDVDGFIVDGEVVDSLDVAAAEKLFFGGTLEGTILPKLGAAIEAARWGVAAFIGRTEVLAEEQRPDLPLRLIGRP